MKLRKAIVADLGFEAAWSGGEFAFSFSGLETATREAGKQLLLWTYRAFADRKGGLDLGGGARATRARWEQAFRDANPELKVCPACLDAQLEEPVKGRSAIDLDHYLPKSLYPPLAVHGLNMAPICKTCNGPAKRDADPLRDGSSVLSLEGVWFPYKRPGIDELRLGFSVGDPTGSVRLEGTTAARQRAQVHDRLFGIVERWERSLKSVHEDICEDLREREILREREPIRRELVTLARLQEKAIKRKPQAYLTSRYCRWLVSSDDRLDDLIKEL